jgi:hypothetical protein
VIRRGRPAKPEFGHGPYWGFRFAFIVFGCAIAAMPRSRHRRNHDGDANSNGRSSGNSDVGRRADGGHPAIVKSTAGDEPEILRIDFNRPEPQLEKSHGRICRDVRFIKDSVSLSGRNRRWSDKSIPCPGIAARLG